MSRLPKPSPTQVPKDRPSGRCSIRRHACRWAGVSSGRARCQQRACQVSAAGVPGVCSSSADAGRSGGSGEQSGTPQWGLAKSSIPSRGTLDEPALPTAGMFLQAARQAPAAAAAAAPAVASTAATTRRALRRSLSPSHGRPLSPSHGRPLSPSHGRPLSPSHGRTRASSMASGSAAGPRKRSFSCSHSSRMFEQHQTGASGPLLSTGVATASLVLHAGKRSLPMELSSPRPSTFTAVQPRLHHQQQQQLQRQRQQA